jgi:hypothetical protein
MRARVVAFALCLSLPSTLACTEKEPEKQPRKRKSSSSETPPQPAAPQPATPEPSPTTSEPAAPSEPTHEWWCVCYQSEAETGPQPASACRAQEKQCRALEKRIARGGSGIVPGSLTHGCRTLVGAHPGDSAGGREAWRPSKLAGAWTAEGACLLTGEAAPPSPTPSELEPADPATDEFAWLSEESIGPLREGMGTIEVIDLLGAPPEKGEIVEEGATGDWVQDWKFPNAGVALFMRSDTERGAQTIAAITVTAPSEYATKRGIKVGSTQAEVEKAYGDVEDQDEAGGDSGSFVAGSVYGGIIFSFEAGKVSEIFMGAAAE